MLIFIDLRPEGWSTWVVPLVWAVEISFWAEFSDSHRDSGLKALSRLGFKAIFSCRDLVLRLFLMLRLSWPNSWSVTSCHQLCHQLKNPQNSMTFNWRPYLPHIYIYFWLSPVVTSVTSCFKSDSKKVDLEFWLKIGENSKELRSRHINMCQIAQKAWKQ